MDVGPGLICTVAGIVDGIVAGIGIPVCDDPVVDIGSPSGAEVGIIPGGAEVGQEFSLSVFKVWVQTVRPA